MGFYLMVLFMFTLFALSAWVFAEINERYGDYTWGVPLCIILSFPLLPIGVLLAVYLIVREN